MNLKSVSRLRPFSLFVATLSVALAILLLNYRVISGWMWGGNGPANLGSIEVSYVTMARYLLDFGAPFPGGSSWMPFWYLGFPFHLFYTPLLPALIALLNKFNDIGLWEGYRLLTGVGYILAPVSVFFLGWQLSKKLLGGVISSVLYSIGPTVFYFLLPEVSEDRFSYEFWGPRRFTILVRWGEGPHIFSLIFMPLVGVFFAKFLENKKFVNLILGALFLGLAGLSNSLGFFAALLLIFSMAFVKLAQAPNEGKKVFIAFFAILGICLGLISFWFNISFLTNFFSEGGGAINRYISLFPWGWLLGFFVLLVFYLIFKRFVKNFGVGSSMVWFLILFSVVFTYYFSAPSEFSEARIELLPQALRYMTEVDLSLSLFVGVSVASLIGLLAKRTWVFEVLGVLLAGAVLVYSFIYIRPFLSTSDNAGKTLVDVTKTREFEISSILNQQVDNTKGERVFVPGNYGFYLNYFTNVRQARGALFQAATHDWVEHIHYQMANGEGTEIAKAWLTIVNAKYAVITTPASSEIYKEIKNLDRFSAFEEIYNKNGDIIYEVPLKKPSLAKPVNLAQVRSLTIPKKADDKAPILKYANWVENSSTSVMDFEVMDNDTYKITGKVGQGEGILVQMTADSGWKASNETPNGGKRVRTGSDPLGFLLLYPDTSGDVEITLKHGFSWEIWLGYATSLATLIGLLAYKVIGKPSQPELHSPQ